MISNELIRSGRIVSVFCALVAMAGFTAARAQTLTWDGGSTTDANFSDGANWSGGSGPAASGDWIYFDGSSQTTPTNDQANGYYTFKGITFNATAGASFTVIGDAINLGGGTTNLNAIYPMTISNNVALTANTFISGVTGSYLTNSGIISGAFSVDHVAAGFLALTGMNTFSGPFSNVQGTVQFPALGMTGQPGPLGASGPGTLVITNPHANINLVSNSSPHLQYVGPGENTDRSIYVSPQDGDIVYIDASGTGPLVFTNTASYTANTITNLFAYIQNGTIGDGNLVLTGTNTNQNTFMGDMYDNLYNTAAASSSLAIVKQGVGTWYLQGVKHNRGRIDVEQGTLMFDSISNIAIPCALGLTTNVYNSTHASPYHISLGTNGSGGTSGALLYTGSATNSTQRIIGLFGNGTISAGNNSGSLVLNGAITNVTGLTGTGASQCTLTLAGGGSNTGNGVISDGLGQTFLISSNAGSWSLTATNTFSGSTEPVAGVLQVSNSLALQNSALDLESSDTGKVDLSALTSLTLGALESGQFSSGGRNLVLTNDAGTGLPLVLNKNDGNTYAYSGVLSGGATLTKTGNSTQQLGALTFSGNATINNGDLVILSGGSITSPQITVAGGATLDVSQLANGLTMSGAGPVQELLGAGTVLGNVTASSGSTISLTENTTGGPTLGISGSLTLAGATTYFNLGASTNAGGNDVLNVSNSLTLGSLNTIVIVPYLGSLADATYPLINYYGGLSSGGLANLAVSPISGYSLTLTNDTVDNPNVISVIVQGVHVAANLAWKGNGSNNNWDVQTTADWFNGASLVDFFQGDSVTFNSSSTNGTVNLVATLAPANVEVTNSTQNYTLSGSGKITSATSLTKDGTGTLTILTSDDNTGGTIIDTGTVQVGNGGTSGWLGSGPITDNGALVVDRSDNNTLPTLSGAGPLTQLAGTLALGNTSSYSGNITVDTGTMEVTNESGLGSGSQVTLGGGGVIQTIETTPDTFNRSVSLTAGGGGFNHAIDLTINSTVTGTGPLILEGAGQSIIPNAESYSGGTILNGGSLAIDSVDALGTNTLTILNGTLFRANQGEQLTMTIPVVLATNLSLGNTGDSGLDFTNGPWTLQGAAAASYGLTINTAVEIDSPIGQSTAGMGIGVFGADILTLTGSNTFTGPMSINSGQVTVTGFGLTGNPSPVGAGNSAVWAPYGSNLPAVIGLISNSSPYLQYVGPGENTDKGIYVSPQDGKITTLDASGSGPLVFTNAAPYTTNTLTNVCAYIQNATAGDGNLVLTGTNTNANTIMGDIYDNFFDPTTATASLAIVKAGVGTWYLQGVKHNRGRIDVENGTLMFDSISNIGVACALGSNNYPYNIAVASIYNISLGTNGTTATLQYTGMAPNSTDRVLGLYGNGTISSGYNGGSLVFNGAMSNLSGSALTLNLAGGGSNAINGLIVDGTGGSLALVTGDVGTWTLTGANSYQGGTTVNSGAILVDNTTGSGTGAGSVQVNSPGEFGGTGIVSGNVAYSDGTLAEFTVGAPMTFQGGLSINGNVVVHLQLPANFSSGSNVLAFYNTSGSSGAFAATPVIDSGSLGVGGSATVYTANGVVTLVANVVQPPMPPAFSGIMQSGTNLVLTGTGGLANGYYYVLMSTNLGLTNLAQWKPVATNTYGPSGGFTNILPILPGQPSEFFLLETPGTQP